MQEIIVYQSPIQHLFCEIISNYLEISSKVFPQVNISTTDALLNCTGICPVINSTVTDGLGPFSYQWFNNTVLIPNATSWNLTACSPGSYNLSVTNTTSGCTNSSNVLIVEDTICKILALTKKDDVIGHIVSRGQIITYIFIVKNIGHHRVRDIGIVDDHLGLVVKGVTLEPNEERSFTKSATMDYPPGTIICNTASVFGVDSEGLPVESTSNEDCLRIANFAEDVDLINLGNQNSYASSSDPAVARNSIIIKKNQKRICSRCSDTSNRDLIGAGGQSASAYNNAKASNDLKILSNQN